MKSNTKGKGRTTISEIIDRAAIAAARAVVAELGASSARREYFKVSEVANFIGMRPHQLSNLVSAKYFDAREGVRRISGKRIMIHWPSFERTVLSGSWKPRFTKRPRRAERNAD